MKKAWPISQILLLGSILIAIGAVLTTLCWTNVTLRSVGRNLPTTLIKELISLDKVLDHLSEVVFQAELHAADPAHSNFNLLKEKVQDAYEAVNGLRRTYVFDNLVQASKFHAVVAPAISDLQIWLAEGISGYPPQSEITAQIILSRIVTAYKKARDLTANSRLNAQKRFRDETARLDHFQYSVNWLFMLTLAIILIMIVLFIHQHNLKTREFKIQTALAGQRDLLNSLFENILLGITVWDNKGQLLFTNGYFTKLTGYTDLDITDVTEFFDKAFPDPSYREKVMGAWKESLKEGMAVREYQIVCKNGEKKDIEFRGTLMPDKRALVSMADTTAANKARAVRRENQLRMKAILEAIPDPMVMYSRTGHPEYVNPSFTRVFGWTLDEFRSGRVSFVPEKEQDLTEKKVKEVYATGGPVRFETKRYTKTGQVLDIFMGAAAATGADGQPGGLVINLTDVTEKNILEAQYEQAQKMESLGTLAGGIAHDFNNLLSGIYGYMDLARLKTKEPKIREYLGKAHASSERAKGLTYQLLTFSKGGAPVKKVGPLVPFLEEAVRFALSGANVACRFDLPEDLWMCDYDRNQMGQVIDNLTINAHHAMPSGGGITVKAENIQIGRRDHHGLEPGRYVKISIADTGMGIPVKYLSKIFDPFFTTKQKGSGLGLATSYSIVKRHGGKIDVQSKLGSGSVFTIFLPGLEASSEQKAEKANAVFQGSGRILIMDDEKMIREMLSGMLEYMGFEVESVEEGGQVLSAWERSLEQENPFRAVILDLTVPGGMGGKDAVRQIRKKDQHLPVFVASGYSEDQVMASPGTFGFTASIEKPFTVHTLSQLFKQYLPAWNVCIDKASN